MKPSGISEIQRGHGKSRFNYLQSAYNAGLRAFAECVPVDAIEAGADELDDVYCMSNDQAVSDRAMDRRDALRTFLREVEEAKR